jgi:hypothetical protein
MKKVAVFCFCLVVLVSEAAFAQDPPPAQLTQSEPTVKQTQDAPFPKHTLGPLEVSVNWRTRAEGCSWFEAPTGESDYSFLGFVVAHWNRPNGREV